MINHNTNSAQMGIVVRWIGPISSRLGQPRARPGRGVARGMAGWANGGGLPSHALQLGDAATPACRCNWLTRSLRSACFSTPISTLLTSFFVPMLPNNKLPPILPRSATVAPSPGDRSRPAAASVALLIGSRLPLGIAGANGTGPSSLSHYLHRRDTGSSLD